ncbi:MAG TPA: hypothetical protein PLF84_15935 [Bryobacteraceae bacterium]|nr:hypothetical protein [Bryobacteraceae bacterium]
MSCGLPSGEQVQWESAFWRASEEMPAVRYRVRRASLARRAELTRRVRGLVEELACRAAGEGAVERLAAAELELEADRIYVEWGVLELAGLVIDGEAASVGAVVEKGPEGLCREMAAAVRSELTLSEGERKN